MKLSQLKQELDSVETLNFIQPDGNFVPEHFHITEAGLTTKHFIDCGGAVRTEQVMNLQVWVAQDIHHRLDPDKLKKILSISEQHFGNEDMEVEVEYQTNTIGRYGLDTDGKNFLLIAKQTDCLAKDQCGTSNQKPEAVYKTGKTAASSCCTPGGGCS